jgi:hypothetical protein
MVSSQLLLLGWCVVAAPPADPPQPPARDALQVAARIDQHLEAARAAAKVVPAALADDAEFLRRVYLDLAGRIPAVSEARAFLGDSRPDKRARLIDKLLASPRYVTHFTNVWRGLMLPEANSNFQSRFLVPGFEDWLHRQMAQNAGYDKMVRELLTAPVNNQNRGFPFGGNGPSAFYLAKEVKPENLAASTARLFLGVRLECAQCHNHPFADWKREQFWSFAAFFAGIRAQQQGDFIVPDQDKPEKKEIVIPGSEKVVQARYIDGSEPQWKFKEPTRETLARWLTAADNRYFARATVNRFWFSFFGTGLVDPVDDMVGGESHDYHPELLDELAREFAAHNFDLKFLIRAITNSRAYQLSSMTAGRKYDPRLFAAMPLRGLTAEQLFDSVAQATGYQEENAIDRRVFVIGNNSPRDEFLNRFASQSEKATEAQTSILQALALMNGKVTASATTLERSETLAAVADSPFLSNAQRIETLYLATLSRKPKARELHKFLAYVENGGEPGQALADVFWILLNNSEFILNH